MATDKEHQKLTAKEERFCYEYLANGFNATKAATKAGYSPKNARFIGCQNLTKLNIRKRIQNMKDNLAETAGVSALMLAQEHAKIAFSNVAHLHNTWVQRKELDELTDDQKSCIQEVSSKVLKQNQGTRDDPDTWDVEYVKIKTYDKQKSLDSLTNLLGYSAPIKNELTGKDGKELFSRLTDEELAQKVVDLTAKLNKARK